jgi:hypothetical protein
MLYQLAVFVFLAVSAGLLFEMLTAGAGELKPPRPKQPPRSWRSEVAIGLSIIVGAFAVLGIIAALFPSA